MSNPNNNTLSLFHRRYKRPGDKLLEGHTILLSNDRLINPEALKIGLANQPIEILISETGINGNGFARINIFKPDGVRIEPIGQEVNIKRSENDTHTHLTLSRYPGQSFLIRPSSDYTIDDCVMDLTEHGIFIHLARIQYQQARLSISASNKWDIVRRELDSKYGTFLDKARASIMFMLNARHHMDDKDYEKLINESSSKHETTTRE